MQFRDSEKVWVRLSSSRPKWPMWPFRVHLEESSHKLDTSGILVKNEVSGWVSTQFRDSEKVRVSLSSSRPRWPMWPFRVRLEESSRKLDVSVILINNEEGGWVCTQFREVKKFVYV